MPRKKASAQPRTPEPPAAVELESQAASQASVVEQSVAELPAPTQAVLPVDNEETNKIEQAVPPIALAEFAQERRNFWGRVLLLLLLCAVLVGAVLIFLYRPRAYDERTTSVKFLYNAEDDATVIAVNGTVIGENVDGYCTRYAYDRDGSTCAALIGGDLHLIKDREWQELCVEVKDFYLSQNGGAIAYRTEQGALYYVILDRDQQTSLITKESADRYCLSPDGKELFYTYVYEESVRADIYSRTGSKPNFTKTTGLVPIAIGDKCKFIYYKDEDGKLYYMEAKDGEPVLCFAQDIPYTLTFNRDFGEVLIDSDLGTQLWCKGERVVVPDLKAGEMLILQPNQRAGSNTLPEGDQYLVRSFTKSYYLKKGNAEDGEMLVYLDQKGALTNVSFVRGDESRVTVTDKGVYYLEIVEGEEETQRHLFRCEKGTKEPERLSWEDISEFCVNTDGGRVLYTDRHGALYAMRMDSVPVRLADSIDAGSLCVTADDAFYYTVDDTLYVSENGDEPRELRDTPTIVFADAYTAYFVEIAEEGTLTVRANHRNRRRDTELANNISAIQ